jgi:ActR/RegA family two-component response regulator
MANDIEKLSHENVENIEAAAPAKAVVDVDVDEEYTYEEQRKIVHRVDRRLIVICGFAYCISLMDRTNVSAAAIAGYVTPSTRSIYHC